MENGFRSRDFQRLHEKRAEQRGKIQFKTFVEFPVKLSIIRMRKPAPYMDTKSSAYMKNECANDF